MQTACRVAQNVSVSKCLLRMFSANEASKDILAISNISGGVAAMAGEAAGNMDGRNISSEYDGRQRIGEKRMALSVTSKTLCLWHLLPLKRRTL